MKVKTNYEHGDAITAGKEYDVVELYNNGAVESADICDDDGDIIYILLSDKVPCAHLNDEGHWEIV